MVEKKTRTYSVRKAWPKQKFCKIKRVRPEAPEVLISVLSKDLEFQRLMSWSSLCSVSSVHMRGECSICLYWWNWWPSPFKLSFYEMFMSRKKSLKIPKEQSESVNRRGTMAKRNRIKGQAKIYKTLHRKLKTA